MTTVRNLKDELDKGAFHGMLQQLGLAAKDRRHSQVEQLPEPVIRRADKEG